MVFNEAKPQRNESNWISKAEEGIDEPVVDIDYQQNDETDDAEQ